jgi:hypothetical protein
MVHTDVEDGDASVEQDLELLAETRGLVMASEQGDQLTRAFGDVIALPAPDDPFPGRSEDRDVVSDRLPGHFEHRRELGSGDRIVRLPQYPKQFHPPFV